MPNKHLILKTDYTPPFPDGLQTIMFGMGCFWGVEKLFWQQAGIYTTAVGYAGGGIDNPTYQSVCSGQTGHTEVVFIVYEPKQISFQRLLESFCENHDPTQGMRQGNDRGTQYRSAIYVNTEEEAEQAGQCLQRYEELLKKNGYPAITTEVKLNQKFYYAEDYHQQYLAKNPNGYCNLRGTGVSL